MSLLVSALIAAVLGAPGDTGATRVSHQGDKAPRQTANLPIGAPGRLDQDRIVCRKTLVLGSVRPKKVCLTAFAWAEREDAAQRTMDSTLYGQGAVKPPIVQKQ